MGNDRTFNEDESVESTHLIHYTQMFGRIDRAAVNLKASEEGDSDFEEVPPFLSLTGRLATAMLKEAFEKDPVTAFSVNILRYCNNDQMRFLRDWLNTYLEEKKP